MSKNKNNIDQDLIRDLAALLKETELSEIEIEQDDFRIRVARTLGGAPVIAHPVARTDIQTGPVEAIVLEWTPDTFTSSSSGDARPAIQRMTDPKAVSATIDAALVISTLVRLTGLASSSPIVPRPSSPATAAEPAAMARPARVNAP